MIRSFLQRDELANNQRMSVMTRPATCPKCSGQMEEGFVLDQTYGANLQAAWVEGPPTRSFWTGIKLNGRERVPVTTLRCSRCGFLESYAVQASGE